MGLQAERSWAENTPQYDRYRHLQKLLGRFYCYCHPIYLWVQALFHNQSCQFSAGCQQREQIHGDHTFSSPVSRRVVAEGQISISQRRLRQISRLQAPNCLFSFMVLIPVGFHLSKKTKPDSKTSETLQMFLHKVWPDLARDFQAGTLCFVNDELPVTDCW